MNIQDWFPFTIDWFDFLSVQGTLKSLLQHHSLKASILWCSAFFMVQISCLYMTNGKAIALTIWTFVSKVMSLLFSMLSWFFLQGTNVFEFHGCGNVIILFTIGFIVETSTLYQSVFVPSDGTELNYFAHFTVFYCLKTFPFLTSSVSHWAYQYNKNFIREKHNIIFVVFLSKMLHLVPMTRK